MEELQRTHRQELRDLQFRITQKKKSATKKTRKGINDECAELERQLKEQHHLELSNLVGEREAVNDTPDEKDVDNADMPQTDDAKVINHSLGSLSLSTGNANTEKPKKPNRQKARLARRAAEQEAAVTQAANEAQDLPNLRVREREAMQGHFGSRGLREQDIRSDGHCLYAAIADQLISADIDLQPQIQLVGLNGDDITLKPEYKATRRVAASYISAHPDDFVPFLEEPLSDYVRTIRETGEWGGHLELLALAKAYEVNINVLQSSGQVDTIEGSSKSDAKALWLAYYRHSFGLGEHYNSLQQSD